QLAECAGGVTRAGDQEGVLLPTRRCRTAPPALLSSGRLWPLVPVSRQTAVPRRLPLFGPSSSRWAEEHPDREKDAHGNRDQDGGHVQPLQERATAGTRQGDESELFLPGLRRRRSLRRLLLLSLLNVFCLRAFGGGRLKRFGTSGAIDGLPRCWRGG